ncbi:meiotic recombination [Vermiconidia calcicola]|uniref:Meiotic recombination n=1 Tax=Vermiconidia calcicola TaxID=1690605 RepID=A0ACC3NRN3_9PEZI|nr:meiotic recombination [Vermiconidia calcicola]
MPNFTAADTIRILVSTDNHVGYNERDPTRGDDSWRSFHEVMCLAKERDVDMVLLAGDLFHDNKPSRKSMYQVMRSLRMNCYGEKPCELEMLSDASETFAGAFNHVNYEDPDINVAIPVFSIHGNHDDPSGEGHLAALDILQMSGLINYYGRTPESDNILVKPVLLQKGNTKLALFGISNVRDERLFRTFRDGNVKFFRPGQQKDDWFNILSVHQNHHAYSETSYLPENFLPSFMDLVVWGHEHKCEIDPQTNLETGFRVMQPGSSVATSLVPGEAVPKQVAILTVTGKKFECETIRLTTVRPFVHREIALQDDKKMREISQTHDNLAKVHAYLTEKVEEMIEEAKEDWLELQRESNEEPDEEIVPPLPLIRLRVEYSAPEGGEFRIDNPQRFSNRFNERVANPKDVVQFHRKKRSATSRAKGQADMPDADTMAQFSIDSVKVDKLVNEFLTAQSLSILPQNHFSESVGMFVDKDDKFAMEEFVRASLEGQVIDLLKQSENDEDVTEETTVERMEAIKAEMEAKWAKGELRKSRRKGSRKPKPDGWDSEMDGDWEDAPASIVRSDHEMGDGEEERESSVAPSVTSGRGRGRGRGGRAAANGTTRKTAAAAKKAPAKGASARGKKKQVSEGEDEEEEDVIMLDDDEDDDEDEGLFVKQAKKPAASKASTSRATKTPAAKSSTTRGGKTASSCAGPRQSQLGFTSQANGTTAKRAAAPKRLQEPSEDEISDDDAFEAPPAAATRSARTARR